MTADIIKKLREDPRAETVYALPGNGGIAADAQCVPIGATDIPAIVAFAREKAVDALEAVGVPCFGPRQNAALIESSKAFAKELMKKYGIPTARFETFTDMQAALRYVEEQGAPIVIKADGLALGKGVTVAATVEEAKAAVRDCMEAASSAPPGRSWSSRSASPARRSPF